MADILRGEIWWVRLEPTVGREQRGRRPVVVVSEDRFNRASKTPIGIALTSRQPKPRFPLTLEVQWPGQTKRSWVKISQIRVLDSTRFESRMGRIPADDVDRILEGLDVILGRSI